MISSGAFFFEEFIINYLKRRVKISIPFRVLIESLD